MLKNKRDRESDSGSTDSQSLDIDPYMMLIASLIEPRAHHGIYESKIAA